MAQTTSLVFNGGVIPSPSPAPAGSGKAKLLKIGEISIVEQEVQVTKKVICDPDSVTTVAPFMEVLTSAKLAELIGANSILVLDDGTVQYLMADATVVVEDGTSVCTSVSFLGLSLEDRAKVLYPCTRITDELTLQQVLEVGEPVETNFDLVKAYPEDTEAGTLIDKLMVEDTVQGPDDQTLLEVVPSEDGEGHAKVAINEDNLRNNIDSIYNSIDGIIETIDEMDVDSVPRAYLASTLNQSPGDNVSTRTTIDVFSATAIEGDCFEFEQTTVIDDTPFGYVWIEPGTYLINAAVTLQWVGNPRGTFLAKVGSVMGENFDFSQEQEISRQSTKVVTIPSRMKLAVNVTYDAGTPVMGFWIQSMQVVKLAGGMSQTNIIHDDTLVGRGSVADPLGVDEARFAQSTLSSIRNLPDKSEGFFVLDDANGTGKMDVDTILNNFAGKFVPNSTTTVAGLSYMYNGSLYMAKEAYTGAWDATKFVQISISQLLGKYAKKQIVENPKLLDTEAGMYYNSSLVKTELIGMAISKYNVEGYSVIRIEARIGASAYSVFRDSAGNVISSFAGNNDPGLNFISDVNVPVDASTLEVSSSDTYSTTVVSSVSVENQVSVLASKVGEKADKHYTVNPQLLSTDDGYRYNVNLKKIATANFAIRKYDVSGYDKIKVFARIGPQAYSVFRDQKGNPISSFAGPNSNFEYNVIQEISVPQDAVIFELSVSTLLDSIVFCDNVGQSVTELSSSSAQVQTPHHLGVVEGYYTKSDMTYNSNASHNIEFFCVEGFSSLYVEARIGPTAYVHFLDKDKTILASYAGNGGIGLNFRRTLSVPSGTVYFVLSHSTSYDYFVCGGGSFLQRLHVFEKMHLTPLSGKKIGILGDSIAHGATTSGIINRFIEVCASDLDASVHNVAVGGAAYANTTSSQVVSQVANLDGDEDLIVIFAGTNDFGNSSPIGDIYETDAGTGHRTPTSSDTAFCPAINKTIQALYTKFGGYVPIVLCTPIQRVLHGGSSSGGSWDKNSINLYMEDYVAALKDEANFWGIPIFDAYKLNMNPNIEAANTAYFADGLHPNDAGHVIIGHSLARFLCSYWFDV